MTPRHIRNTFATALAVIVVGWLLVNMWGCVPMERTTDLTQKQRENVSQKALADFVQSVKPNPTTIVLPDGTRIEQTPPTNTSAHTEATEGSDSASSGFYSWSESVPFFVKLIGVAVGGALLVGLVWFIRKQSVAVNAAWQFADDRLAGLVKSIQAKRATSTDPAVLSALTAVESDVRDVHAEALK